MKVTIEKVANGYILDEPGVFGETRSIYGELADVFGEVLARFEGRRPSFGGDLYGEVAVFRVKQKRIDANLKFAGDLKPQPYHHDE
jgi:hypothetical protein